MDCTLKALGVKHWEFTGTLVMNTALRFDLNFSRRVKAHTHTPEYSPSPRVRGVAAGISVEAL